MLFYCKRQVTQVAAENFGFGSLRFRCHTYNILGILISIVELDSAEGQSVSHYLVKNPAHWAGARGRTLRRVGPLKHGMA